jgi:hypothetical protein
LYEHEDNLDFEDIERKMNNLDKESEAYISLAKDICQLSDMKEKLPSK